MSYDTSHALSWDGDSPDMDQVTDLVAQEFEKTAADGLRAEYRAQVVRAMLQGEPCSWREHEEHIRAVSLRWPEVLFTLEGWGDEREDIWRKYFQAGRMAEVQGKIVFPDFDPGSLA